MLGTTTAAAQCPLGLAAGLLPSDAEAISSEPLAAQTEQRPVVVASESIVCEPTVADADCEAAARAEMAQSAAIAGAGATIMTNVIERPAAIIATFDINGIIESLRFDDTESVFAYIAQQSNESSNSIIVQSITSDGIAERVVEVTAVVWQPQTIVPDGLRLRFRDALRSMDDVDAAVAAAAEIWGVEIVRLERVAGGAGQYLLDVRCADLP